MCCVPVKLIFTRTLFTVSCSLLTPELEQWFSDFSVQNDPDGLRKCRLLGPVPRVFDWVHCHWGLRICSSVKFSGVAEPVVWEHTLRTLTCSHQLMPDLMCFQPCDFMVLLVFSNGAYPILNHLKRMLEVSWNVSITFTTTQNKLTLYKKYSISG